MKYYKSVTRDKKKEIVRECEHKHSTHAAACRCMEKKNFNGVESRFEYRIHANIE